MAATSYTVTSSEDDGNFPINTQDNKLDTRWSAKGEGNWIKYDLGSTRIVDALKITFYKGDIRAAIIDIEISEDGKKLEYLVF